MRPKDIGTAGETAVVKYLRAAGWPNAERRALAGQYDLGDVTGCPRLVFEVKAGQAAKTASDGQVSRWLAETETERVNADAAFGVLVMARAGIGAPRAGDWWAVVTLGAVRRLTGNTYDFRTDHDPVRLHLATACHLLIEAGYGTAPLADKETSQ